MSVETETAEQVVRMVLQGSEVVLRLTGEAALEVAKMIYSALKYDSTSKGKATLWEFMRSGKNQMIFEIPDEYIEAFTRASKKYGFPFVILKNKDNENGVTDIMVYESDASKVDRVKENLKLNVAGIKKIQAEITDVKDKDYKPTGMQYKVPMKLIDNMPQLPSGDNLSDEDKKLVSTVKEYATKLRQNGPRIIDPIQLVVTSDGHYEVVEGEGRKRLMSMVLAGYKEAISDILVPIKKGQVEVKAVSDDAKEPQERTDEPMPGDDSPAPVKKEDNPNEKEQSDTINPSFARMKEEKASGHFLEDSEKTVGEKESTGKPSVKKELEICKQISNERMVAKTPNVPIKAPDIKR